MPEARIILIPVYNDWTAVSMLLAMLDDTMGTDTYQHTHVLLVDDGSTEPLPQALQAATYSHFQQVTALRLRRNLGHQRAIAIGICYIEQNLPCRCVVVMDGDGEDAPSDVLRLLQRFDSLGGEKFVFAERARRSESLLFRLFYEFYKAIHLLLTGLRVKVGNFSVIPGALLTRLVVVSDLWNHYAAAVLKARMPLETLPVERARRLDGKSHMNFTSLVVHGLSAMSVYGDRIGVRLLFTASAAIFLAVVGALLALFLHFGLGVAVPQWVIWLLGGSLLLVPQFLLLALVFVFLILGGRDSSAFLPIRDYQFYIHAIESLNGCSALPVREGNTADVLPPGS